MGHEIIHQPRLAWDGARAFVAAADTDHLYPWLGRRLATLLGPAYREALSESRWLVRLAEREDAPFLETAKWRARLDDALRYHPELADGLRALTADVVFRMSAPGKAAGLG
ncbi:hypothetical protein [Micromonospora sp. CPCC 206061]|uniref:hypothetical protein n=1 Tax=Micromonospora sp. CPCC 206061 TaxID=3122410 RepID=UPI002FEE662C